MSSSFAYKVRDPLGNVHEGSVDAGSVDDVLRIEHGIISSHRSRANIIIDKDYSVRKEG